MEMKRRRVTQACDRCRALKSKCDGLTPICGRCKAYGYNCTWQTGRRRGFPNGDVSPSNSQVNTTSNVDTEALRQGIQAYDELVVQLRTKAPHESLTAIDLSLARIRMSVPPDVLEGRPKTSDSEDSIPAILKRHYTEVNGDERYLGEASDLRFVNAVQDLLHISLPPDEGHWMSNSYEREARSGIEMEHQRPPEMPTREEADRYFDIYFATVHVAYPFLCQTRFREQYKEFWETQSAKDVSPQFFCTMLAVFALGSLYTMFSSKASVRTGLHERLYEQSWTLAKKLDRGHSRASVCMLLVQCFYLFASCETERCWTTLGVAIKIAQSLGFHAEEDSPRRRRSNKGKIERELRRRCWHSCYVLDCMISLQTGRPQMIRMRETAVSLPHPLDESRFDFENDMIPPAEPGPQFGDYLAGEIRLSYIVEQVIIDLYGPRRQAGDSMNLSGIEALDRRLLQWRHELPRHLRFDLGHAFERSVVFRKQRNFLGIKFHYLRALIHRPHLCLKWLKADIPIPASTSDSLHQQVLASERICIAEAQEIAHMLHHITNEQDVIHDFPWWQMISCLLCACSILIVASKWAAIHHHASEVPREVLEEEAATCLRVFDALGKHFDAARLAGDMMRVLQSHQFVGRGIMSYPNSRPVSHAGRAAESSEHVPFTSADLDLQDRAAFATHAEGPPPEDMIDMWSEWPVEFSDSLLWSQQFVLPAEGSNTEGNWEMPPGPN